MGKSIRSKVKKHNRSVMREKLAVFEAKRLEKIVENLKVVVQEHTVNTDDGMPSHINMPFV
jgi:hypothetical protein